VGRRPERGRPRLEPAGIAHDARGFITVDDQCRTTIPGVWALGECNGHGAFTHTAYNDYEICFDKSGLPGQLPVSIEHEPREPRSRDAEHEVRGGARQGKAAGRP